MKNNVILLSAILFSGLASAQIGINSQDPKTTLDIHAKNSKGTSNAIDGLLIPRVDRQRAQSMTNIPESTLIYVNDITTGTQAGIATAIDYPGYYYFDGRFWIKLNPNISGTDQDNNLYNTNGILDADRLVEQNDKTLAFTGTAVNAFSVDGNTFSVDAKSNRIGVGTTTPAEKVDVKGAVAFTGQTVVNKTGAGTIDYAFPTSSPQTRILSWGADPATGGAISFWTGLGGAATSEKMRVHSDGNVGIGTATPTRKLDVQGSQRLNAAVTSSITKDVLDINIGQDSFAYGNRGDNFGILVRNSSSAHTGNIARINFGDINMTAAQGNRYLSFSVGKTLPELMYMDDVNGGRVGIGTSTPDTNAILDLSATNKGFLPPRLTTAQRNALTNRPAGLMVYNVTTNCLEFWNSSAWVSTCAAVAPVQGVIGALNCNSPVNSGTLTAGTAASITSKISYTGGNGGSHGGQAAVPSTGVTGLTATLNPANFNNGAGELAYFITGTPSASGTASFAVNIGGKMCDLKIPVSAAAAVVTDILCNSATNTGALTAGVAASGVSSKISYTGGNGGTYDAQAIPSTGVTGLTATLVKGNVNNGTGGSFTYTITGTPNGSGTALFNINVGGKSCSLQRTVTAPAGTITNLDCNGRILNGTLKNNTAVSNVTFSVPYTGGNGGAYNTQSIPSTGIPGLTAKLTASNFNVGTGSLTYTIEGTPLGEGTASFNINIGGRNCTVNVTVNALQESEINCTGADGNYPYPNVPTKYVKCITIQGKKYAYIFTCPAGTQFNPTTIKCVAP
jgi:hypothetical protein